MSLILCSRCRLPALSCLCLSCFQYELNVDLLTYYFNLLTRYVQIHMLVHLIDTPQLFLASYARAFHHTSGNTEPNFIRIAKYLAAFKPTATTSPLKKMQDDAQAISLCVGNALMTFAPLITKYASVAGYMAQGKLFNVLQEDAKNLTWAVNEKAQLEVMHLSNMRSWVLWGFLVCPAEAARPGAVEMLALCLRETYQLQIFRDKCINIHREYEDLMDYKSPNGSFKMSKHKKLFKDAQADDEGMRKFHLDLRTYLRTELEVCDSFFQECPSCVAPKLQMLLALVHLARNEVVWWFRHRDREAFKGAASKHKAVAYDPQLSDLIYLCTQIIRVVESNKKEIQSFYVEYLTQIDAPKARSICDTFIASAQNPHVASLVHAVIDHLHERSAGDNLESVRLNWYRMSAAIANQSSGIPIHKPEAVAFATIMNQIVHHTRCIDLIDTQLKAHASFQMLFWYREELFEMLKVTLGAQDGRAANSVALVTLLHSSLHNVHRLAPDEQPMIGKEALTTADKFIRVIVNQLERNIQAMVNDTVALRARTNHTAVLQRIAHNNAMASNPNTGAMAMPGDESQYEQRRQVANLAAYHKAISDLCGAISRNETIVVYNIEFVMREYVAEAMSAYIRGAILGLCVQGPAIQKPSLILNRLKDSIYALMSVERALNINVADMVREVLVSEMTPAADEAAQQPQGVDDTNRHVPIINHIAHFYQAMFAQDLALSQGIVYSSLRRCFVSRKGASSSGSSGAGQGTGGVEFERFTDVTELRALCTLIGPAGVGVIDRALLKVVAKSAKSVKEVLLANQTVLLNLQGRFTEQSVWLDNIGILQGMDQLCSALTIIGCILHFRQLLRDALRHCTQEHSPFVLQAVRLAHRAIHDSGVVSDPRLSGVDYAAADVGLDLGEADHALRLALAVSHKSGMDCVGPNGSYCADPERDKRSIQLIHCVCVSLFSFLFLFFQPLKTTVADMNMFSYLPELLGLMYLSQRWRSASFSIELEGHTNNNHCMALAVRQLLVQFNRIHVKENASALESEKRIGSEMERFVRCSAFTILHLKVINARGDSSVQYPIPHIMLFLEQIVLASAGRVEMAALETCFPFTMLRTNFIQVYEVDTHRDGHSTPVCTAHSRSRDCMHALLGRWSAFDPFAHACRSNVCVSVCLSVVCVRIPAEANQHSQVRVMRMHGERINASQCLTRPINWSEKLTGCVCPVLSVLFVVCCVRSVLVSLPSPTTLAIELAVPCAAHRFPLSSASFFLVVIYPPQW